MRYTFSLFLIISVLISGCSTAVTDEAETTSRGIIDVSTVPELREIALSKVDETAARKFSDGLVSDLIANNRSEVFNKMAVHIYNVTEDNVYASIDLIDQQFGHPELAIHKYNEPGVWDDAGEKRYFRRFYYAIKTSKEDLGKYFLTIEVIADDGELYCQTFKGITFLSEIPDELKL